MNQITEMKNTFGEVIHDHKGTYLTVSSGGIRESEISQFLLKDTEIGENDDVNVILDMGPSKDCRYVWCNYCAKQSAASVAMGRSHVVYADATLDNVKDAEILLFYPYAGMEESQSMLKNTEEFQNKERREFFFELALEKFAEEMKESVSISKELMYYMICYSLKQKSTGFRNFLYIAVPDDAADYQKYCRSVMAQFLGAIPAGLRKQLRFATNAAPGKESNYHILFARESVLRNSEKWQKTVCVSDAQEVPAFLKEHGMDANLAAFLRKCVGSVYNHGEENVIDVCFEEMETKIGDINAIKERDYRDYYEILKLGKQSLTVDVLKEYSEKLGQTMAEKQKQMLYTQIDSTISGSDVLEETLRKDAKIMDAATIKELLKALDQYKKLLQYLKKREIEISKAFYEEKIAQIQTEFWAKNCEAKENAATESVLKYEKAWEEALQNAKESLTAYFAAEYMDISLENSANEQKKLEEKYQKEQIEAWKAEVRKSFSPESLRETCQKIKDHYPTEVSAFCKYICEMLVSKLEEKPKLASLVKSSVDVLREYDSELVVPEALYEAYVTKTMKILVGEPNQRNIQNETAKVGEIYGEENKNAFAVSLRENLTQVFYEKLKKETSLDSQAQDEMTDLLACIKMLASNQYADTKLDEDFAYWCDEKRRCERRRKMQESIRTFEGYFYSCKRESELMKALEKNSLRKQIRDRNVSEKKISAAYTVGAFLAGASYAEGTSEEKILANPFYLDEFERFMDIEAIPILIQKQMTIAQIYAQAEAFQRLCNGINEDITFICYDNKKMKKIHVSCHVAKNVLDTLIKVRNQIPMDPEEREQKKLSISEKEFWEFLFQCGVLSMADCEKLAVFGEKAGIKDLEELGDKFLGKKKSKKVMTRITKGIVLVVMLVLFAGVFFAGRASKEIKAPETQTEESDTQTEESETQIEEEVVIPKMGFKEEARWKVKKEYLIKELEKENGNL